jgi:hypothetical protein
LLQTSPCGGHPVGADDDQIDHAVLHQMAAGVVGDHGVRHAVMAELPGGQRGALVARPGLIDPDMDGEATVVREIDRRGRRAPVHRRQPAGVAMGQHVDPLARFFRLALDRLDQGKAVPADALVDGDVLFGDFAGAGIGRPRAPRAASGATPRAFRRAPISG